MSFLDGSCDLPQLGPDDGWNLTDENDKDGDRSINSAAFSDVSCGSPGPIVTSLSGELIHLQLKEYDESDVQQNGFSPIRRNLAQDIFNFFYLFACEDHLDGSPQFPGHARDHMREAEYWTYLHFELVNDRCAARKERGGMNPRKCRQTALYAAMRRLVENFGDEPVYGDMVDTLERVRLQRRRDDYLSLTNIFDSIGGSPPAKLTGAILFLVACGADFKGELKRLEEHGLMNHYDLGFYNPNVICLTNYAIKIQNLTQISPWWKRALEFAREQVKKECVDVEPGCETINWQDDPCPGVFFCTSFRNDRMFDSYF